MGKSSKNSRVGVETKVKDKIVTSNNCEVCTRQCLDGVRYLRKFQLKGFGNGVHCRI